MKLSGAVFINYLIFALIRFCVWRGKDIMDSISRMDVWHDSGMCLFVCVFGD